MSDACDEKHANVLTDHPSCGMHGRLRTKDFGAAGYRRRAYSSAG